jgi:hypothetical protein
MASVSAGITGNKEEGYNFTCPLDVFGRDRPEGSPAPACGFTSLGWAVKSELEDRVKSHYDEHYTGVPMPELIEVDPRRSPEERAQALQAQSDAKAVLAEAQTVVDEVEV